jgi:hypothetical protein
MNLSNENIKLGSNHFYPASMVHFLFKMSRNPYTMKPYILLLTIFLMIFSSCEKKQVETPDCIKSLISTYPFCANDGGGVSQYSFQGQMVYVFDPGLCRADMASGVYNENCEQIGILGGIAGNNIVNNEIFIGHAKFIKTIWSN